MIIYLSIVLIIIIGQSACFLLFDITYYELHSTYFYNIVYLVPLQVKDHRRRRQTVSNYNDDNNNDTKHVAGGRRPHATISRLVG